MVSCTIEFNGGRISGSISSALFRPPPGGRTRPSGGITLFLRCSNSGTLGVIVVRDMPVNFDR